METPANWNTLRIKWWTVSVVLAVPGCSSIQSIERPDPVPNSPNGLVYFMPKRDLVVTIRVENKDVKEVTFGVTDAYPDVSKPYVLRYGRNPLGKNTLDVGVTPAGLLTSTKSTTVSGVSTALKNLVTSVTQIDGLKMNVQPAPGAKPCSNGTHKFVYEPTGKGKASPCGVNLNIDAIDALPTGSGHSNPAKVERSGVYYRLNLPYKVIATFVDSNNTNYNMETIILSPNESATFFLPASSTFFSNSSAEFGFVDGVPTKFGLDTDGEIVALLKLPADVISAYFAAVGSLFESFSKKYKYEAEAQAGKLSVELAKKKYEMCTAAILKGEMDLVKSLECGK